MFNSQLTVHNLVADPTNPYYFEWDDLGPVLPPAVTPENVHHWAQSMVGFIVFLPLPASFGPTFHLFSTPFLRFRVGCPAG